MEGRRRRDHPFSRPDRINFPEMSRSMWECPLNDSFGTPQIAIGLSSEDLAGTNSASPAAWTPLSNDISWITMTNSQSKDSFFRNRERCGLLTPARSPADILRRGSLLDPFSQSGRTSDSSNRGSSNRSKASDPILTPSSASGTPDVRASWSNKKMIIGQRGAQLSQEGASPSRCRSSPSQGRTNDVKSKNSRTRCPGEFSASPIKRTPEAVRQVETGLSRSRPSVGLPPSGMHGMPSRNIVGDRDPDSSLSVSSISFGRGDMRVHASEGLGGQATTVVSGLVARGSAPCRQSIKSDAQTPNVKETIARQLDFGADTAPIADPDLQISQYSTMPRSDLDSADWESSLLHETTEVSQRRSHAMQLTPSFRTASPGLSLREFSPLCSGASGLSSCPAFVSPEPDSVLSRAGAFHGDQEWPTCESLSNLGSTPIQSSSIAHDKPLHVSVEKISSCSDGGGVLLQLRLGSHEGLDRSLHVSRIEQEHCSSLPNHSFSQIRDSGFAGVSGRTASKASQTEFVELQNSWSRSRDSKEGDSVGRTLSKASQTDYVVYPNLRSGQSLHANRSFSAPQLCRSDSLRRGRASLGYEDEFSMSLEHLKSLPDIRRGGNSIDNLRDMVQNLHERYLQQFFQVKPIRFRHRKSSCMSWDRCGGRRKCGNGWSRSRR